MSIATERRLWTAEEYMASPEFAGTRDELVRGEVVPLSPPAGLEHGITCAKVGFVLSQFTRASKLGYVAGNDSAVLTTRNPDSVRGADVAYYPAAKVSREQFGKAILDVPPDVIFEVLSPYDPISYIRQKISEHLEVGVGLVGIVDPRNRTVTLFRADALTGTTLHEHDRLADLPELPGFQCDVAEFFV